MEQNQWKTQWKTKVNNVDIDTGELIPLTELNNYILIKKEKHVSIQNGHGTIEHTKQWRRAYIRNIFTPTNE